MRWRQGSTGGLRKQLVVGRWCCLTRDGAQLRELVGGQAGSSGGADGTAGLLEQRALRDYIGRASGLFPSVPSDGPVS
jgi:hypothetical protein